MKTRLFKQSNIDRLNKLEGIKLASFKKRAFAFIFDIIICVLLFLTVLIIAGLFIWYKGTDGSFTTFTFTFDVFSWYGKLILNIGIPVMYFGLFTYFTNGKTLGKKLFRIRIVSLTKDKISFWNAMERALGYGASIYDLFTGFFKYFFNDNCQTSHDCIADTIVVCD